MLLNAREAMGMKSQTSGNATERKGSWFHKFSSSCLPRFAENATMSCSQKSGPLEPAWKDSLFHDWCKAWRNGVLDNWTLKCEAMHCWWNFEKWIGLGIEKITVYTACTDIRFMPNTGPSCKQLPEWRQEIEILMIKNWSKGDDRLSMKRFAWPIGGIYALHQLKAKRTGQQGKDPPSERDFPFSSHSGSQGWMQWRMASHRQMPLLFDQ